MVDLNGYWDFQITPIGEFYTKVVGPSWEKIPVPSAWESQGIDVNIEGVGTYRKIFNVEKDELEKIKNGKKVFIKFNGVSAYCKVWLNGIPLEEHLGIWDPFVIEITPYLKEENELLVKVIKPGKYLPLRESLAGFLPDVYAPFGGIWQPVEILIKEKIFIDDVSIRTDKNGKLSVYVRTDTDNRHMKVELVLDVLDGEEVVASQSHTTDFSASFELSLKGPKLWSPQEPNLYTLRIRLFKGKMLLDEYKTEIGFRSINYKGYHILLNNIPIYPRGILHWGWYPESISPYPDRETISKEIRELKSLGFNLIKFCLFVPPKDYFEIADREGILIWQELPMWLPKVTCDFKRNALTQYRRIVKNLHSHPSIVIWTLGCEMNKDVDEEFIERLFYTVKKDINGGLIKDNSGSGECYGGLLKDYGDFYDYHFYTDPHFYRDLIDRFGSSWREKKPWLFGEFCDFDTVRDIVRLREKHGGDPFYLNKPKIGIDWPVDYKNQYGKLKEEGLLDRLDELVESSKEKAFAYRKMVLELVRSYERVSGYVITSMRDTPIATSGIFDDLMEKKFKEREFLKINNDIVLSLGWDNKRNWINGGDRLIEWDRFNYSAKSLVRAHLILSYYGTERVKSLGLKYLVRDGNKIIFFKENDIGRSIYPGYVGEIDVIEFIAPRVAAPKRLRIEVSLEVNGLIVENHWYIWIYPNTNIDDVQIFDPKGVIRFNLEEPRGRVFVSTRLDDYILDAIYKGARVLYIQPEDGDLPTSCKPFFRESIQVLFEHPVLKRFSPYGLSIEQWYSLATDRVFPKEVMKEYNAKRIISRLDTRTYILDHYLIEVNIGKGILIATTLRFNGGLGDQAENIEYNSAGRYLLKSIVRYLSKTS
ncbi:MAG: glycoside hydrolase family 2 protein [bacterium]